MAPDLIDELIRRFAPDGFTERKQAESDYPVRQLPSSKALVTRVAPSPTGFVHIGTIYAALLNRQLAHQSGGLFILRIEDTDKKREVEGSIRQIDEALNFFGLNPDESPQAGGNYGPYIQSQRAKFYLGFAVELLRAGRAYPCFATTADLETMRAKQQAAKVRPGYYGEYVLWRERSASEVLAALKADQPFVLRFRSEGKHTDRLQLHDELKGDLNLPQNDLDVPLIKSDGLPTYHLAHIVDDYLMRVNMVLRGDEWLSSLPLHCEMAAALGITPFRYAHFAPISIMDNDKKRKLSKRKDEEADIRHWQTLGYPPAAILDYLTSLASADFESWRQANPGQSLSDFNLSFSKLAMSRAPLLDVQKLDNVSKNVIATFPQDIFTNNLLAWAEQYDPSWSSTLNQDPAYTEKVLAIERNGDNRRKDLANWSQSKEHYGFFYDEVFDRQLKSNIETELSDVPPIERRAACQAFLQDLDLTADQPTWFKRFRQAAETAGYTTDRQAYKAEPTAYKGTLSDFAKIIRVLLSGSNRTPDLYLVMQVLGADRVRRRLSS